MQAVHNVLRGRSLDDALETARRSLTEARDLALLQALCYGVLRDWRLLEALSAMMLRSAPADQRLQILLALGLHQLRSMRIPAHAAVAATVDCCPELQLHRFRSVVNAVLRRYQREQPALDARVASDARINHSHPDWMAERFRLDWGSDAGALMAANNVQAPMVLRVNRRRISRDDYLQRCQQLQIGAQALAGCADGVMLEQALPVEQIPGFVAGEVSVQDGSAQFAAALLAAEDDQRVLDACAAPGGKTAHLLEHAHLDLLALDCDPQRLHKVQTNLQRLGLQARCQSADAARIADWTGPDTRFDRILLDAPCSGSGVIRRHPDIKWLRRASDLERLAAQQLSLLNALWPLLAPGGKLVYATCSTFYAEGDGVIRDFLRQTPSARRLPIALPVGQATALGWRIAPGGGFDGFYYAILERPLRRGPAPT